MRYYTIIIGHREYQNWFPSDRYARRVLKKLIPLWKASLKDLPLHSMASYIATTDPEYYIYRHAYHPVKGVISNGKALVDSGTLKEWK